MGCWQEGPSWRAALVLPSTSVWRAVRGPSCADFVFDDRGVAPEDAAAVLNASFFTPRLAVGCLPVDWYRLGRWNLIPGELVVRIANYNIAEGQRQASPSSPSLQQSSRPALHVPAVRCLATTNSQ